MSHADGLRKVPRTLLREEAYRAIREAIVNGTLAPGEVIRDQELAQRVGLSRTPVREALARLTEEGLVESKPNAFTRVTPLQRRDAQEAYVVLRTLHELAVREAVPRLTPGRLAELDAANRRFAAALEAGDVEAALAADDEFHGVFIAAAANRALAAAVERLTPLIRRLERLRFGSLPGRTSIREHERIISACESGDAGTAARLADENWANLGELIARAFDDAEKDPAEREVP